MALRDITNRALAAAAVMAVAAGAWGGTAGAQAPKAETASGSSFGIRAGEHGRTTLEDDHFTYDVPAGTSVEDSVILVNNTNKPLRLRLYPADLISADGGGFAPAQPDVESKGVGLWARVDESIVDLGPSATEEIGFEVDVPANATPGEHLGAIVASTLVERGTEGLAVETRAALIAKVRVPGELAPELNLGPLTSSEDDEGGRVFSVTVTNPGNVLLEVPGHVAIESGGDHVARLALTPPDTYVIPGGSTTLTARWDDPPLVGRFIAHAEVAATLDGDTTDTYRSGPLALLLVPWLLAALCLATLSALVLIWLAVRRRMRRTRAERRQQIELLEEMSSLLAERRSNGSADAAISRRRQAGVSQPHRQARPPKNDPPARHSPRSRRSSTPR